MEQWAEVLTFGIDTEVSDLLPQLQQHATKELDDQVRARLVETRNRSLQQKIVEYFRDTDSPIAVPVIVDLLLSEEELPTELLRVSVRYVSDNPSETPAELSGTLLERYVDIAEGRDPLAAAVAVEAIGSMGTEDGMTSLLELYDETNSTDLRGAIIRSLGEAEASVAVEMLTGIASDTYEESSLRQYAADSLGKIGDPESLSVLQALLSEDDSILRAYVVHALGYYDDDSARDVVIGSLRDSFWRVRIAALQGIAEQDWKSAVPAVIYKAQRDPERPVRIEAIETLGTLATPEAFDALREIFTDVRSSVESRTSAAVQLIENDLVSSLEAIAEVVQQEWDTENSRVLDVTAKTLSQTETPGLAAIYERLLEHPNFIIRIYAIRGIGLNGLAQYRSTLQRTYSDSPEGLLRNSAQQSLELLGIPLPVEDESAE